MGQYSVAERIYIVETYMATKSYEEVKNKLRLYSPHSAIPANSTIKRLVDKFRVCGSISNKKHQRQRTVLTDEKVLEIQGDIIDNPNVSTRRLAQQVNVSHKTVYRAVRQYLKLFPYKVTVTHELLPADYEKRVYFCEWLGDVVQNDAGFLDTCYFTDEAWFHLNGYVNSQNTRYWSGVNPHIIHEEPLHSSKVGVWAALSAKRICIVFFDSTITSVVYRSIVDQFAETLTEEDIAHGWFQQDNAPPHTANQTLKHLEMYFGERLITRNLWPPRSPDLSPPDFFLWGYLKSQVYCNKPTTLTALRQNIQASVSTISAELLSSVMHELYHRLTLCCFVGGGHFQHL
jgi:transposase